MRVAVIACLLLASCATGSIVTPEERAAAPGAGETACLVRGLGGPFTSYVEAGRGALEGLGYRVVVHDMGASPADLEPCQVIVAHSWGAPPALETTGPRRIFVIDGFDIVGMHCPAEAKCVNFHNITNITGAHLDGAENIPATGAGAIPFLLGHMIMPAQPEVWTRIVAELVKP